MADQGCHLINLSLGGSFSQEIDGACREVAEQGVIIFASMGNSGLRGDGHPGNSNYTYGITAVDYNKRIANFSSRSSKATYCGYGVQVLSCSTRGRYTRMSGTSMSSPDVTGMTTLFYSYLLVNDYPLPTSLDDLANLFDPAVIDLGSPNHDREYGHGFIDIWKLLNSLPTPPNPNPPNPPNPSPNPPTPPTSPFAIIKTSDGSYISDPTGEPATFKTANKTIDLKLRKL